MAVRLDGQTQARGQMGVNVVCPRHLRLTCYALDQITASYDMHNSGEFVQV